MKKLIDIIVAAIAVLAGFKQTIKTLRDELAARDATVSDQAATIEALKADVAADSVDDAALEKAATDARAAADAAEARAAELQAQIDEANKAADDLAAAINDHPDVPVNNADFTIPAAAPAAPPAPQPGDATPS